MRLGTELWPGARPYLNSERGTREERSAGHGVHRTLVPTVRLGCPRPPFLPLTLPEEGRHANRGLPRARPAHLSALMLELSSQPRFRGWRGVPSWETLEEAPAKTTEVPAHESLHSDRTHCWVPPGAQALPPAQLLEEVMLPEQLCRDPRAVPQRPLGVTCRKNLQKKGMKFSVLRRYICSSRENK